MEPQFLVEGNGDHNDASTNLPMNFHHASSLHVQEQTPITIPEVGAIDSRLPDTGR